MLLDTNVLVAAFATRGLCADVLRVTLQSHELIVTEVVLEELERALVAKLGVPAARAAEARAWLAQLVRDNSEPSTDAGESPHLCPPLRLRDPSDVAVVESAVAAGAELIVTGDRDLLEAELPIPAVSPREFWGIARGAALGDEVRGGR